MRKVSNKISAAEKSKRSVIVNHYLRAKKVLYAFFFSGDGVAIQMPVKNDKRVTVKYYRDVLLKK